MMTASSPSNTLPDGIVRWLRPAGMPVGYAVLIALLASFFQRGGHDEQRVLQVVLLGAGSVMLLFAPPRLFAGRAGVVLGGFFGLGALSSMVAWSPRMAGYEVATLLLSGMLALAIGGEVARQGAGAAVRLLNVVGLVCGLYALKVVAVYLSVFLIGVQPEAGDFTPGFNNFRFLNYAQTLLLPMLVAVYALSPAGSATRRAWFLVCALWFALVLVTAARGTALGIAVGCAVAFAILGRHAATFLKALSRAAIGGGLLYIAFFHLVPMAAGMQPFGDFSSVASRSINTPVSGRLPLWELCLRLIMDNPWLGVGPLHFAHEAGGLQVAAHPHNWVLQVGAEWGLPALLLLLVALWLGARTLRRTALQVSGSDVTNQLLAATLLVAGAAVIVDGMVSGNIVMPHSQLVLVLYLGLASGWCAAAGGSRPAANGGVVQRTVIVLSLLALVNGTWPEMVRRIAHEPMTAEEVKANGKVAACPRLWVHGFF